MSLALDRLVDFDPWLADYAFVSVALIHERRLGEQSDLAPWMRSSLLPDRPDVPLLWSAEQQAELKGSTTAPFESRLAEMRDDYAWLQENVFDAAPVVFPAEVFTWDAYVEAHAIAFSRCCILASKDAVRPALLPLLDLANHVAEPSARIEVVEAKTGGRFGGKATLASVDLVATSDLASGAEVCVRYGGETAGDLLVDYGFADSRAPPLASLEFEIEEEDPNYDDKCDVLENEAGLAVSQPWVLSAQQPEPPPELMAVLRLRHMDGSDAFLLEGIFRQVLWPEHLQLPISRANEEKAVRDAIDRCTAAVAGFSGSMQSDLGLLAEAEPGTESYQLATVRYAERRALEASARWFEAALERLGELEYYQERRLRNLGLEPIETAEELDALRAENMRGGGEEMGGRAGGRKFEGDIDW